MYPLHKQSVFIVICVCLCKIDCGLFCGDWMIDKLAGDGFMWDVGIMEISGINIVHENIRIFKK